MPPEPPLAFAIRTTSPATTARPTRIPTHTFHVEPLRRCMPLELSMLDLLRLILLGLFVLTHPTTTGRARDFRSGGGRDAPHARGATEEAGANVNAAQGDQAPLHVHHCSEPRVVDESKALGESPVVQPQPIWTRTARRGGQR